MSNRLTTAEKELLASLKTGRSRGEIFNSIAASIRNSYEGEMSEEESKRLARNFIGFCQKIIDIEIRLDNERNKKE